MGLNNLSNDTYRYFVPKGTKINLAKYCLSRVFWKMLFGQPLQGSEFCLKLLSGFGSLSEGKYYYADQHLAEKPDATDRD